jgi:hypothetical protein
MADPGSFAAILGPVEYWALAAGFLLLILIGFIILMILLARWTHGFKELKARIAGKPLVLFFDDNRTVEWKNIKPDAGIIEDDFYGSYLINEKGTYIDKKTRNIIIPFSTTLAVGAPVRLFKMSDDLQKILGDEKQVGQLRVALAKGELDDEKFDALKESVNFSYLKSLSNTIIPHNITAKVNMEVAKRLKSFGNINPKQIIIYVILVIGAIGLMALILWLTIGNGQDTTTIIREVAPAVTNASNVIAG